MTRIYVVDAFTAEVFRGNPAAVVTDHLPEPRMRALAAEMRHSETAYLRRRDDGGYDLRWFTPEVEVDLCGHATLASAYVLFTTGALAADETAVFHTRSGELRATRADDAVTLDFPLLPPAAAPVNDDLLAALGIEVHDFLRSDGNFFGCVVDDPAVVRGLDPDFARLRAVPGVRGVYVTAPGDDGYDIVSRCFAPLVGIDEDPVTGSMHCVLAAYWCDRLGRDELRAFQASARGGEMRVVRRGDRVLLTGRCAVVLEGDLAA